MVAAARPAAQSPPKSSRLARGAPGWKLTGDGADVAIEKTYDFADYYETISFVNAVAFIANAQDHYPDLAPGALQPLRGALSVPTTSRASSETDFECAARVDALLMRAID